MSSQQEVLLEPSVVREYLKKTGDDRLHLQGNELEIAFGGFAVWNVDGDTLNLIQVYGDGDSWDRWACAKARSLGLRRVGFFTQRSPDAIMRRFGYELHGFTMMKEV